MVLRVRLNFPGNEQTNDKQKFLSSLVADWLLLYTARKFKSASRPLLIIPSSAFLYIASSCTFLFFLFVSSNSVVHHAWCRQLHSQKRHHRQAHKSCQGRHIQRDRGQMQPEQREGETKKFITIPLSWREKKFSRKTSSRLFIHKLMK